MAAEENLDAYYQEWLDVPAERLPPNHYAVLGLEDFESASSMIEEAAKSRGAYLHQLAAGPQRRIVQQMLGQVAVAKRTLMDDASREEYNRSLRSESQPSNVSEPVPAAIPTRRRSAGSWKYHAISAGVLLGVVGIIWFVNRNPGGRRAADVRAPDSTANEDARLSGADRADVGRKQTKASAPATMRSAETPTAGSGERSGKTPTPVRRRGGVASGLGDGLQNKFGSVLEEISDQANSETGPRTASGSSGEFRPVGGITVEKIQRRPSKDPTPDDLRSLAFLPLASNDSLSTVFAALNDENRFKLSGDGYEVIAQESKRWIHLSASELELLLGESLKVSTSLSAEFPGETRLAIAIDGVQIGIKPTKSGIEVYGKGRGDSEEQKLVGLGGFQGETALWVGRGNERNQLRFFVSGGSGKGEKRVGGTIRAVNMPERAPVQLVIAAPRRDSSKKFEFREVEIAREKTAADTVP